MPTTETTVAQDLSFLNLARKRYSCRKYQDKAVEQDKLDLILEAARVAPTACNNQPQRIRMITSSEELAKIDAVTPCRFGAPAVALVCYDNTVCWSSPFEPNHNSGDVDVSIIVSHMIFEATELGLGTCWVMYFDPKKAAEEFNLPANLTPVALLPMGYAASDATPAAMHDKSITIAQMTF
ncbi:MAG: nitroreductase family protein [Oscillospiraceae bacterium]|jgi:nitroreductase|nr:nitroreductase family protein [Oscillospiraceae bacterium]